MIQPGHVRGKSGDKGLEALIGYLKQNRGIELCGDTRKTIARRLSRRMQAARSDSFTDYIDYLEVHPEEFPDLFNTILIKVTSFFRDLQAWDKLRTAVIPAIIEGKGESDPIRVWSA